LYWMAYVSAHGKKDRSDGLVGCWTYNILDWLLQVPTVNELHSESKKQTYYQTNIFKEFLSG